MRWERNLRVRRVNDPNTICQLLSKGCIEALKKRKSGNLEKLSQMADLYLDTHNKKFLTKASEARHSKYQVCGIWRSKVVKCSCAMHKARAAEELPRLGMCWQVVFAKST